MGKKLSPESIAKREATRKLNRENKKLSQQQDKFYNSTYLSLNISLEEIENLEVKILQPTITLKNKLERKNK